MADFVVLYAVSSRLCSAMTGGRRYNPMWFFIKANQSKSSFVAIVRHPVADAFIRTRSDLLNSTPQFLEFTLNAPWRSCDICLYLLCRHCLFLSHIFWYVKIRWRIPKARMSAFTPKADIGTQPSDVRFVPKADIRQLIRSPRQHWRAASAGC